MQHLKELPPSTLWPHLLEAIERDVLLEIQSYADTRMKSVERGAETRELAAVFVDKYARGMARALHIAGLDTGLTQKANALVRDIDPAFDQHRDTRWTKGLARVVIDPTNNLIVSPEGANRE